MAEHVRVGQQVAPSHTLAHLNSLAPELMTLGCVLNPGVVAMV